MESKDTISIDLESHWNAFLNLSHEMGCVLTTDGFIKNVNFKFAQETGYSEKELISEPFLNFIHPDDIFPLEELISRSDNTVIQFKNRFICKGNTYKWLEWKASRIGEEGLYASARISSQQKETNLLQRIEIEKQYLDQKLNNSKEGYFILSRDWFITSFSPNLKNVLGFSKEEILNTDFGDLFSGAADSNSFSEYKRAFQENVFVQFEEFYPALSRWFEVKAFPSENTLTVFFKDITEKKIQQITLKLEKEVLEMSISARYSLKQIVDHLLIGVEHIYPDMICSVLLIDKSGLNLRYLSSPSLPELYTKMIDGDLIGLEAGSFGTAAYLKEMVVVSDIANHAYWKVYKELAMPLGLRASWSIPIINAEQQVLASFGIYFKTIKEPTEREIDSIKRVGVILQLLIESNEAKQDLQISNERYYMATSATNDIIWDWDFTTNELYLGEGHNKLFGYNLEKKNIKYTDWTQHFLPQDFTKLKRYLRKCIKNPSTHYWQKEYRCLRSDNSIAHVLDNGYIIRDINGNAIRMVGALQDITQQKQNVEKLKRSEENYKLLFLNNPIPMWLYDLEHLKINAVNNAAINLYGYTEEEFLGKSIFDMRPKEEHARLKKIIQENVALTELTQRREWSHLKKDKSIFPVEIVSHIIVLKGKKSRLIAITDITEKKKAQQEILDQNQKLREIAQISSHEIRGPVASILGLVNILNKKKLKSDFNREIINCLDISAHELDKVIHDIVDTTWNKDFESADPSET